MARPHPLLCCWAQEAKSTRASDEQVNDAMRALARRLLLSRGRADAFSACTRLPLRRHGHRYPRGAPFEARVDVGLVRQTHAHKSCGPALVSHAPGSSMHHDGRTSKVLLAGDFTDCMRMLQCCWLISRVPLHRSTPSPIPLRLFGVGQGRETDDSGTVLPGIIPRCLSTSCCREHSGAETVQTEQDTVRESRKRSASAESRLRAVDRTYGPQGKQK